MTRYHVSLLAALTLLAAPPVRSQSRPTKPGVDEADTGGKATVSAGYLLRGGEVVAVTSYFNDSYDRFWVGTEEMALPPVLNEITTQGLVMNFNVGLSDDLEFSANVPYTHSEADSVDSPAPPQASLGDIELGFKWRMTSLGEAKSTDIIAHLATRFPASDYEPDRPVAIGHHSTDLSLGLIAFHRWSGHAFTSVGGAYSVRSDEVPNDFRYHLQLGFDGRNAAGSLRYEQLLASKGTDIGGGSFTSNEVEYRKVGFNVFLRPWGDAPFGLTGDLRWVVGGRNIGKAFGYSLGVVIEGRRG